MCVFVLRGTKDPQSGLNKEHPPDPVKNKDAFKQKTNRQGLATTVCVCVRVCAHACVRERVRAQWSPSVSG